MNGVEPEEVWLTVKEAAARARRHPKTITRAARAYLRSGRTGLEAYQERPRCCITIPVAGLDRWVRGEPPRRREQKLKRVG